MDWLNNNTRLQAFFEIEEPEIDTVTSHVMGLLLLPLTFPLILLALIQMSLDKAINGSPADEPTEEQN